MRTRKFLYATACCTSILLLSGCHASLENKETREVTAEFLVDNALVNTSEIVDMQISYTLEAEIVIGEGKNDEDGNALEYSTDISISSNTNIKSDNKYGHTYGETVANVAGTEEFNEQFEVYYDYEKKIQYIYNPDKDIWTHSAMDDESLKGAGRKPYLDSKIFDDLKLEKHTDGKDYSVTATTEFRRIKNMTGSSINDNIDTNMENTKMDVVMLFDSKTKKIKSIKYSTSNGEYEGIPINIFCFEQKFNHDNIIKVEIPKSVFENSIDEES